jgi:hypothetical protein
MAIISIGTLLVMGMCVQEMIKYPDGFLIRTYLPLMLAWTWILIMRARILGTTALMKSMACPWVTQTGQFFVMAHWSIRR